MPLRPCRVKCRSLGRVSQHLPSSSGTQGSGGGTSKLLTLFSPPPSSPDPVDLRLLLRLPAAGVLPHARSLLDGQGWHGGHALAQVGLAGHRAARTSGVGQARRQAEPSRQNRQQASPQADEVQVQGHGLGSRGELRLAARPVGRCQEHLHLDPPFLALHTKEPFPWQEKGNKQVSRVC